MILKLLHVSVFITHYWSRLFAFGRGRYGRFVHGLSIATAVGTMVIVAPARAGQLTEWQFDPDTQQLELTLSDDTTPSYFLLAQPTRIVVDLPNTVVDRLLEEESFSGDVRNIRVSQFAPGLTRIVIELSPQTELSPSQVELRHVTPSNVQGQEQWIVRPVFASSAIADTGVSTPSDFDLDQVASLTEPGRSETTPLDTALSNAAPFDDGAIDDETELDAVPVLDVEADDEDTPEVDAALEPDVEAVDVEEVDPELASSSGVDAESAEEDPERDSVVDAEAVEVNSELDSVAALDIEVDAETTEVGPELDSVSVSEAEVVEADTEDDIDATETAPSTLQLSDLPPLEPGGFEIPVEIPPPLPESETDTSDIDSINDLADDSTTAYVRDPQAQEEATSAPSLSEESQLDNDPSDVLNQTEIQPSADSELDESPDHRTRRHIRTPDELEQALSQSLPDGISVSVVDRQDDESASASVSQPSDSGATIESVESQVDEPSEAPDDETSSSVAEIAPEANVNLPQPADAAVSIESELPAESSEAIDPIAPSGDSIENSSPENTSTAVSVDPTRLARVSDPQEPLDIVDVWARYGGPESHAAAADSNEPTLDPSPIDSNAVDSTQQNSNSDALLSSAVPSEHNRAALALSAASVQQVVVAQTGAEIPSGTVLRLRYPRLTATLLPMGVAWQDVLLLEQTLLDEAGNVIAAEGTEVIGRFEFSPESIRFVTQAIALDGQNIQLQAVSGWVPIASGSNTIVIRPNQIVNVRLAEQVDL